jgi:hypothetical protein
MNDWYVWASTILFTVFAFATMRPPFKSSDVYSAAIHAAFATWGWVSVARLYYT